MNTPLLRAPRSSLPLPATATLSRRPASHHACRAPRLVLETTGRHACTRATSDKPARRRAPALSSRQLCTVRHTQVLPPRLA